MSIASLVVLSVTIFFSFLSIGFGVAGTGGIIPIAWIVAAAINAIPLLLAVAGLWLGIVGRDRGVGIAAIAIGAVGLLGSAGTIALCVVIGLMNLPQ